MITEQGGWGGRFSRRVNAQSFVDLAGHRTQYLYELGDVGLSVITSAYAEPPQVTRPLLGKTKFVIDEEEKIHAVHVTNITTPEGATPQEKPLKNGIVKGDVRTVTVTGDFHLIVQAADLVFAQDGGQVTVATDVGVVETNNGKVIVGNDVTEQVLNRGGEIIIGNKAKEVVVWEEE